MHSQPLHSLNKTQIRKIALTARAQGILYDISKPNLDDVFKGSIDRFCDIAHKLRFSKRVLDVGAGHGILLSLLAQLGHECYALDIADTHASFRATIQPNKIRFQVCNVEVDTLPFASDYFDAVVCCQVLEHFTHSHLHALQEIYRVLKIGGIVEIDVPNAASFRNRSRMIRGKHITYDYAQHYLHAKPILYNGMSFYPERHNREFVKNDLLILLRTSHFKNIQISYLKSRRYRVGLEKFRDFGSALRDFIPSFRKSLIAFAEK
jgi:2-polyprenyl-3-methyl-5-hydroxy-6-metoxy-1,4-benzoquinol methylase